MFGACVLGRGGDEFWVGELGYFNTARKHKDNGQMNMFAVEIF